VLVSAEGCVLRRRYTKVLWVKTTSIHRSWNNCLHLIEYLPSLD